MQFKFKRASYNMADKHLLEKVQIRAIMMITNLKGTYEERLASLNMRTLEEYRARGDLIESYKFMSGKNNVDHKTWFSLASDSEVKTRATTGYLNLTLRPIPKTDLRKNFFSHRVVPHWNQLPDSVKMAETTNDFKNSLDKHNCY